MAWSLFASFHLWEPIQLIIYGKINSKGISCLEILSGSLCLGHYMWKVDSNPDPFMKISCCMQEAPILLLSQ